MYLARAELQETHEFLRLKIGHLHAAQNFVRLLFTSQMRKSRISLLDWT
jgi:hypothetical protein